MADNSPNQVEDMLYEYEDEYLAFQTFPHFCGHDEHNAVVLRMFNKDNMSGLEVGFDPKMVRELIQGLEKAEFWMKTNMELRRGW